MSIYTNDLKHLDNKSRGFIIHQPAGQPWTPPCAAPSTCVHVYVGNAHPLLVSICLCLLGAFLEAESVQKCVFPLQRARAKEWERESTRIPLGVPLDIWLRIDGLNLRLKRPAEPLGAAALHIITSLLRLCLELGRNPIVWSMGLQICCVSFYATSSLSPASHLLQIRHRSVFREAGSSLRQDR